MRRSATIGRSSPPGPDPRSGKALNPNQIYKHLHHSSFSVSEIIALKRGEACAFCRKRKLKCDAVRPRCGQCTRLKKTPCEYAGVNRNASEVGDLGVQNFSTPGYTPQDPQASRGSHRFKDHGRHLDDFNLRPTNPFLIPEPSHQIDQCHQPHTDALLLDYAGNHARSLTSATAIPSEQPDLHYQTSKHHGEEDEPSRSQAISFTDFDHFSAPDQVVQPSFDNATSTSRSFGLDSSISPNTYRIWSSMLDGMADASLPDIHRPEERNQDTPHQQLVSRSVGICDPYGGMQSSFEASTSWSNEDITGDSVHSETRQQSGQAGLPTLSTGESDLFRRGHIALEPGHSFTDGSLMASGFQIFMDGMPPPHAATPHVSPDSIIEISRLSPSGFSDPITVLPDVSAAGVPGVLRDRLIGAFTTQARRFGIEYDWPRLWERLRGDPSQQPHPAWLNAMFTIGARGSDDPILKKMERHFCETAMEQFDLGATGFTQVLDVIRAGTCLGAYMYWTAQVHKAWDVTGRVSRLVITGGLHQIPTGSFERLKTMTWLTKDEEEPWSRRDAKFSLPPPRDAIELGDRINAFWDVFNLDRAGSIATQWSVALPHELITTPWPLPFGLYTHESNAPIIDVRLSDLVQGRAELGNLGGTDRSMRSLTFQLTALTERCSQLIHTPFTENSSQVESNRLDQYFREISSSRRHPKDHTRMVEALAMLAIKIPAEFKQVVTVLSMSGPYETIQVANIENCFLEIRLLAAQIYLYDLDDWQNDNSRALNAARRMISYSRLIPDHEFAHLDIIASIFWTEAARVLIKGIKRSNESNNHKESFALSQDLDALMGFLRKSAPNSLLASMQMGRITRWRKMLGS